MNLLDAMTAFVRVAELGSYTRAAETLNLSRTRISRLIMELESHLGVRLLQRTTRRLHLTEAGESYLASAQGILQALEEAEAELGAGSTEVCGRLRVNGPMSFGMRFLSPLIARFMVEHPALEVRLDLNDRRVDLLEEGYDLAIRIGSLPDSTLVARRLARCRLVPCASPEYLARYGEPQTLKELTEHRCLRYRTTGGSEWQFGGKRLTVHGPLESNNGDVLTHAAEAGLGIAHQPSFLITESIRQGRLVPLLQNEEPVTLGIYGVFPARRHLPAKVERLLDYLAEAWGDPPEWEREMGLSPIAQ
ncbi:LysR family transcriptional regulator [Billgrantia aerodenitrificans]|uniref:LysR family transcriptional regulator n=1 Tax=Billgrantia aerodenitrificans TaxID=2733483 RepID=A0ABS9B069_9GAMM|nr:LysR family transcriptional regulator [Halomonas aerodenitrificans]MCE8027040.1 LysR family transcriptional regulator [Halomonas aerodenitrificans]